MFYQKWQGADGGMCLARYVTVDAEAVRHGLGRVMPRPRDDRDGRIRRCRGRGGWRRERRRARWWAQSGTRGLSTSRWAGSRAGGRESDGGSGAGDGWAAVAGLSVGDCGASHSNTSRLSERRRGGSLRKSQNSSCVDHDLSSSHSLFFLPSTLVLVVHSRQALTLRRTSTSLLSDRPDPQAPPAN